MSEYKELRDLTEEIGKTFHDFKKRNDQEIAEIKESGKALGQTVEAAEKSNARIDELYAKMDEVKLALAKPRFDKQSDDKRRMLLTIGGACL